MSKKEMLQSILEEYNTRTVSQIHIVYSNGEKAGIGNQDAIKVAMDALKSELKRQISEC